MNNEQLNGALPSVEAARAAGAVEPPAGPDQLGGVIRVLRRQLGMTQEELAQALGITVGTVSRWEKGRFRPSRLARVLIAEFARTHNVQIDLKTSARH